MYLSIVLRFGFLGDHDHPDTYTILYPLTTLRWPQAIAPDRHPITEPDSSPDELRSLNGMAAYPPCCFPHKYAVHFETSFIVPVGVRLWGTPTASLCMPSTPGSIPR